MNVDRIQQIAAWLAATDIGQLELNGPGQSLLLRRQGATVVIIDGEHVATAETPAATDTLTALAASVGVFLHRHPLRDELLAAPGTQVHAGQALGLLQIGPLLLPVPAPADATVHELLAAHGAVVGYGAPLVALHDAAPA